MDTYGFSAEEACKFVNKVVRRHAASTSFYWESEETEEVLDLLAEVVAELIAANNAKIARDLTNQGHQAQLRMSLL
jgi:hypothetical protein